MAGNGSWRGASSPCAGKRTKSTTPTRCCCIIPRTAHLITFSDGNGPFAWRLPLEPTENCVLRLEAYRSGVLLGHDRTDASFAIVPAITGVEPNLGTFRTLLSSNVPNPFSNFHVFHTGVRSTRTRKELV